jgi:hypothetical protein
MTQYTLGLTRLLGHGRAFSEVIPLPNPAVSTGFTYTVSQYWELIDSLSFRLVTDANAANRQVLVTVNDGGGTLLAAFPPATVQAAAATVDYCFLAGVSAFLATAGGVSVSPIYHGLLQPNFNVTVTIAAKQVGDQVSRIRFNNERFVTGPEGYLLGVVDDTDPGFSELVAAQAVLA